MSDGKRPGKTSSDETKLEPSEADPVTSTHIDLGDDLLLRTRTLARPKEFSPSEKGLEPTRTEPGGAPGAGEAPASAPPSAETADELVVNAKILVREGLLEEAKQQLRLALRRSSAHREAQKQLDEIQKLEIQRLLSNEPERRRGLRRRDAAVEDTRSPGEVRSALERELGLDGAAAEPSLQDRRYASDLEQMLILEGADAGAKDLLDWGMGLLEMGFLDIAIRHFEGAKKAAEPHSELERVAVALKAETLLRAGEPFQALLELEPMVLDAALAPEEKIEFGYLKAQAHEALGQLPEAALWYRGVVQLDPDYRDAKEHLVRLLKPRAAK